MFKVNLDVSAAEYQDSIKSNLLKVIAAGSAIEDKTLITEIRSNADTIKSSDIPETNGIGASSQPEC